MTWKPWEPDSIQCLQIVYKIAERCNLNCSYCYYYHLGDQTALTRPALTSLAATTELANWLAQGCRDLRIPEVLISFHGGEPMLMRAVEFARTCDVLARTLAPVVDLRFSIQTNGTLLTDGWLEALKRYQVNVGISIDGRRADHDRFRLDHQGRSSFQATELAISRLVEASHAHPNLWPGTISVLHHEVDYGETYRYLRGLGVRSMHFLLPDRSADDGGPETEERARAIGTGLLDIFKAWMVEDNLDVQIRFIGETLGHFDLAGQPGPTSRQRKSNQVLVARSDETVAIDDSLIPALEWYRTVPSFPIARYTLRDVLRDPIFSFLETEKHTLPDDCAGCVWATMCGGGDLENRYSRSRGFNNRSVYCGTYKILYHGICDLLVQNGYPRPEVSRRFGKFEYA